MEAVFHSHNLVIAMLGRNNRIPKPLLLLSDNRISLNAPENLLRTTLQAFGGLNAAAAPFELFSAAT
jgi:hypothetical protein